ncbi:alpha/beta fold hydrolase [Teredinibacter purpureus]|uniref:alpha/beta fold hydrolase n=1 Tax=Teredinibacter purpureus TaxID=2731756 RepID=UPI0005F89077|nr:alpha/beta fold hydrolase [Teredinibacter purpureus]
MTAPKTLVFLPGFLGAKTDFDTVIAHLPSNVSTVVLTLPDSVKQSVTFDACVVDWFKSTQGQLPTAFYLYGYSLGGRFAMAIAQYLSRQSPDALRGLMIESAHPGLSLQHEKTQRLASDKKWANAFKNEPLGEVLLSWYRQPVFSSLTASTIAQFIQKKSHLNGLKMAEQLLNFSLANQPNYSSFLRSLTCPLAYLSGEYDRKFTHVGRSLGVGTHRIIKGAGHNIHYSHAKSVAKQLTLMFKQ